MSRVGTRSPACSPGARSAAASVATDPPSGPPRDAMVPPVPGSRMCATSCLLSVERSAPAPARTGTQTDVAIDCATEAAATVGCPSGDVQHLPLCLRCVTVRSTRTGGMGTGTAVTLKALAEELGLNASTVSRVLNDPEGLNSRWASQATRERIFALAEERGYRKNPYAASLRTAKSQMVGVVVPRLQDYVLATIYEGIDEAATEHGYFTVVSNSLDEPEAHRAKAEKLLDRRADGL